MWPCGSPRVKDRAAAFVRIGWCLSGMPYVYQRRRNLGAQYGIKVTLSYDQNIERKDIGTGEGSGKGYGSVSIGYSGVSNGNVSRAQQKGQIN